MERINLEILYTPESVKDSPVFLGVNAYKTPSKDTQLALVKASSKEMVNNAMLKPNDHHLSRKVHELIKNGVVVLLTITESKEWGPKCTYKVQGVDQNGKLIFPQFIARYEADAIAMYRNRIIAEKDTNHLREGTVKDFLDNDLIKDAIKEEVNPLQRILPKY